MLVAPSENERVDSLLFVLCSLDFYSCFMKNRENYEDILLKSSKEELYEKILPKLKTLSYILRFRGF